MTVDISNEAVERLASSRTMLARFVALITRRSDTDFPACDPPARIIAECGFAAPASPPLKTAGKLDCEKLDMAIAARSRSQRRGDELAAKYRATQNRLRKGC